MVTHSAPHVLRETVPATRTWRWYQASPDWPIIRLVLPVVSPEIESPHMRTDGPIALVGDPVVGIAVVGAAVARNVVVGAAVVGTVVVGDAVVGVAVVGAAVVGGAITAHSDANKRRSRPASCVFSLHYSARYSASQPPHYAAYEHASECMPQSEHISTLGPRSTRWDRCTSALHGSCSASTCMSMLARMTRLHDGVLGNGARHAAQVAEAGRRMRRLRRATVVVGD